MTIAGCRKSGLRSYFYPKSDEAVMMKCIVRVHLKRRKTSLKWQIGSRDLSGGRRKGETPANGGGTKLADV